LLPLASGEQRWQPTGRLRDADDRSRQDVVRIHNRQVVVLRPESWRAWLDLSVPEEELLRPLPAGSLSMEVVRRGREEEPKQI
jgi:putative SOS response-associated peptidase YedK